MVQMMAKKSVADLSPAELKGKKVLVRCDLNVPLDGKTITDDTRIRASVPTLKYLLDAGAKVAACSHLGRPKDGPEDKFSLGPCAERMTEYIGSEVKLAPDCVGAEVSALVNGMDDGQLCILENTRFYKEETKNEAGFVEKLAEPFDLFVNDAFGTAHRAHASTEGVTKFLSPSVSGFLLAKELEFLDGAISSGEKPLAAIVGGSKVSSKITVLEALIKKCNKVIIGGGMVFTFLAARGLATGSSLVEEDFIETAKAAEKLAKENNCELILPSDVVIADKFAADANSKVVDSDKIPDGWMGLDNGPKATEEIKAALADCKTVVWNGPMGVFEFEKFADGTNQVAQCLADITKTGACTIIGGGDSVAAVEKAGLADQMSHISTGGGASLELLEGKVLPGVAALDEA
jgi:phosphoglycerate kinase